MKPYVSVSVVTENDELEVGYNFIRIPRPPSEWCITFIGLEPLYKELWKFWLSDKFSVSSVKGFMEKYCLKINQYTYGTKQTDDVKIYVSDEQLAVDTAKFIADWYDNNKYLLVLYDVPSRYFGYSLKEFRRCRNDYGYL